MCSGDLGGLSVESILGGNISSGDYEYNWYSSQTNELVGTTASINVPEGGYFLLVNDDDNCIGFDETMVEDFSPLDYTISTSNISCFGFGDGSISVDINGGGTPPYSYNWLDAGGATSSGLFNIPAGVYNLEVTDASGCMTPISVTLSSPSDVLSAEISSSQVSCYGEASGSATLAVIGGSAPYSYNWSSGHVTNSAFQLVSGDYDVTITDASGCELEKSVSIVENPEIEVITSVTPASCYGYNDGSASAIAQGGTGQLTYDWSTGDISSNIVNQIHGEYLLVVEDEIGCLVVDSVSISHPAPLKLILQTEDVFCFGDSSGSVISAVDGGTPFPNGTYLYSWMLDGNVIGFNNDFINNLHQSDTPYELSVTDANGCTANAYTFVDEPSLLRVDSNEIIAAYCNNIATGSASVLGSGGFLNTNGSYQFSWDDGTSGPLLTNKTDGDYTVIVKDDNDCENTMTVTIPLIETFFSSMESDSLFCFEDESGTATVITEGGFSPYVYTWNWSEGSEEFLDIQSSNIKINLPSGVSSVSIEDVHGCVITDQIEVNQPDYLIYTYLKENDESCSGDLSACDGQFSLSAIGGTGNYTYEWANLSSGSSSSITTSASSTIADGLCAGFYSFSVKDANSCVAAISGSGSSSTEIVAGFEVSASIDLSSISNDIVCYGDTTISTNILNPNDDFTYTWFLDGNEYATGLNSLMPAGDISVQANYLNCVTESEIYLGTQPDPTSIISSITDVSCFGFSDGSIDVEALNSQGYSYNWSNDSITPSISFLSAGLYSLSITNSFDCVTDFNLEITEPSQIEISSEVTNVSCNGGENGSILVSVVGGNGPYVIDWLGVDPNELSVGNYTVEVTDIASCMVGATISVGEPPALNVSFDVSQSTFTASASGGTPNYSYDWLYFGFSQGTSQSFTPTESGDYTLVVTDANGCENRFVDTYNTSSVDNLDNISFNIYPNPMSDYIVVEVEGSQNSRVYDLKLIDYRGRTVRDLTFKNQVKINRDDLATGIYMLHITNEDQFIKRKVMISDKF
jgi:hypothetical protein